MATDIDVTYQWWLPGTNGLYHYSNTVVSLVDAQAMFAGSGSMLPDNSKLFKIEFVPVTIPGVGTATRRDVTELPLPSR
jgi:hypothetical protein